MCLLWIQSSKEQNLIPLLERWMSLSPISIEFHKEVIIKEIERKLVDKRERSLVAKEISNVVD